MAASKRGAEVSLECRMVGAGSSRASPSLVPCDTPCVGLWGGPRALPAWGVPLPQPFPAGERELALGPLALPLTPGLPEPRQGPYYSHSCCKPARLPAFFFGLALRGGQGLWWEPLAALIGAPLGFACLYSGDCFASRAGQPGQSFQSCHADGRHRAPAGRLGPCPRPWRAGREQCCQEQPPDEEGTRSPVLSLPPHCWQPQQVPTGKQDLPPAPMASQALPEAPGTRRTLASGAQVLRGITHGKPAEKQEGQNPCRPGQLSRPTGQDVEEAVWLCGGQGNGSASNV